MGLAELGMAKMGRGSLKSGVARFCWLSEIIGLWIQFCWVWVRCCWVLLVVEDRRCLGLILLGFCWSFVGFVLAGMGGG